MKACWISCLLLCLAGCASFGGGHATELSDNRLDHEYCAEHGLSYPDPGYVQCRWNLVNSRAYRQWRSEQMMRQASQPALGGPGGTMALPEPQYRPVDREHFHCRLEPQFGNDYVFCGYDGADGKPH
ncbi:MAG TPA: hypothetical protein VF651_07090 [Gammaproteobacteria bacterium]